MQELVDSARLQDDPMTAGTVKTNKYEDYKTPSGRDMRISKLKLLCAKGPDAHEAITTAQLAHASQHDNMSAGHDDDTLLEAILRF